MISQGKIGERACHHMPVNNFMDRVNTYKVGRAEYYNNRAKLGLHAGKELSNSGQINFKRFNQVESDNNDQRKISFLKSTGDQI